MTPEEITAVLDRAADAARRVQKAQEIVKRFAQDVIHFSSLPIAVLPYQVPTLREQLKALEGAVDALEATISNVQGDIDAAREAL